MDNASRHFRAPDRRTLKRFRVIALDPRSQGDSEKTPEGNYLERHAQDIKELIEHLGVQDVLLLGWSNGVPDVLTFVDQNGAANARAGTGGWLRERQRSADAKGHEQHAQDIPGRPV